MRQSGEQEKPLPQQILLQQPQGLPRLHQLPQILLDHGRPLWRGLLHHKLAQCLEQGQLDLSLWNFSQQPLWDTWIDPHACEVLFERVSAPHYEVASRRL